MKNSLKHLFIEKFKENNIQKILPINYYFMEPIMSSDDTLIKERSIFHNNPDYRCGIPAKPISKCINFKKFIDGN